MGTASGFSKLLALRELPPSFFSTASEDVPVVSVGGVENGGSQGAEAGIEEDAIDVAGHAEADAAEPERSSLVKAAAAPEVDEVPVVAPAGLATGE